MQNYGGAANFSIYQNNTDSCVSLYYSLNNTSPIKESKTALMTFNASTLSTTVGTSVLPIYNRTTQPYSGDANIISPTDCVADYTMDDNTSSYYVRDYCYDSNTATAFPPGGYTNTYSTTGLVDKALNFSGSNHYIMLPGNTEVFHAFSIILWFKRDFTGGCTDQGLMGGPLYPSTWTGQGISINLRCSSGNASVWAMISGSSDYLKLESP